MMRLPILEHYQTVLGTTGTISILAHGLLLGVLGWAFPYTTPEPVKDTGISIDLAEVIPEPKQDAPMDAAPAPPPAAPEEPQVAEESPAPAPKPVERKKVEKPKPVVKKAEAKPKQVPTQQTTPSKQSGSKPSASAATSKDTGQVKTVASKTSVASAPISAPGNPRPVYPDIARKRGQEGTVQVRCQVNSEGKVISVSLAKSSGHKLLDEAAMKTVSKWKFRPAMSGGVAVAGSVVVPVDFRLR